MKPYLFLPIAGVFLFSPLCIANVAPEVVVHSAEMRPGTTLMDVSFRVNDPDDATVKVRALAFVDGVRSFANVIRPVTFAEGTGALIGDGVPSNTDHTLTWDVAADWDVQLGQVKFEILAMDDRGLLPMEWVTIPGIGTFSDLTISRESPPAENLLSALFWLYASEQPDLHLANGSLSVSTDSGVLSGLIVADGPNPVLGNAAKFLYRVIDVSTATLHNVNYAVMAGAITEAKFHLAERVPWRGVGGVTGWGNLGEDERNRPPENLGDVVAIGAAGPGRNLALLSDGTVVHWGSYTPPIPPEAVGVTRISVGMSIILALRVDGTVIGWGGSNLPPSNLTDVVDISSGGSHALAATKNGTVVAWTNLASDHSSVIDGQAVVPEGLNSVVKVAAGLRHSVALKSNGTVVCWGSNSHGQSTPPQGLSDVVDIKAGFYFTLALKADGTIVGWGTNPAASPPQGLTGVVAITAGSNHALAIKSDGTVVGWGMNAFGQTTPPQGLVGISAIAAADGRSFAVGMHK